MRNQFIKQYSWYRKKNQFIIFKNILFRTNRNVIELNYFPSKIQLTIYQLSNKKNVISDVGRYCQIQITKHKHTVHKCIIKNNQIKMYMTRY